MRHQSAQRDSIGRKADFVNAVNAHDAYPALRATLGLDYRATIINRRVFIPARHGPMAAGWFPISPCESLVAGLSLGHASNDIERSAEASKRFTVGLAVAAFPAIGGMAHAEGFGYISLKASQATTT